MSRFGGMPEWFPRELLEVALDGTDMVEGFTAWLVEHRMIESPDHIVAIGDGLLVTFRQYGTVMFQVELLEGGAGGEPDDEDDAPMPPMFFEERAGVKARKFLMRQQERKNAGLR